MEKLKLEEEEEEPEKYEDKYNFIDYSDDENENEVDENEVDENNIINDATPDGKCVYEI